MSTLHQINIVLQFSTACRDLRRAVPVILVGAPQLTLASRCLHVVICLGCLSHPCHHKWPQRVRPTPPLPPTHCGQQGRAVWIMPGKQTARRGFFLLLEKWNSMRLWSYFYFPSLKWIYACGDSQRQSSRPGKWRVVFANGKVSGEEWPCSQRPTLSSLIRGIQEEVVQVSDCFLSPLGSNLKAWPTSWLCFSFPFCWVGTIIQIFLPWRDTWEQRHIQAWSAPEFSNAQAL